MPQPRALVALAGAAVMCGALAACGPASPKAAASAPSPAGTKAAASHAVLPTPAASAASSTPARSASPSPSLTRPAPSPTAPQVKHGPVPTGPAGPVTQPPVVQAASVQSLAGCGTPVSLSAVPTPRKEVALTFDDGPGPYTPQVLAVLAKYGVHATFFDTGKHAAEYPNLVRAEVAGGNVVGNHTWSHPQLTHLTDAQVLNELSSTEKILSGILGHDPCLMRPPYGEVDSRVSDDIRRAGYTQVLWDVDTRDWSLPGTGRIVSAALNFRVGGSPIILMHAAKADPFDGSANRAETVAALPKIIEALKAKGYTFVQVSGAPF